MKIELKLKAFWCENRMEQKQINTENTVNNLENSIIDSEIFIDL